MKYMPTNSGSTIGAVSGSKVSYKKGVPTEDLPKGELDHCGFEPVEKSQKQPEPEKVDKPTNQATVAEIKAYLDEMGTEYTSAMKKAELLELV